MKAQYCETCKKKMLDKNWYQVWDYAKKKIIKVCGDNPACMNPYKSRCGRG